MHRLFIPLAALLAVVPMLIQGPSCGHDFDFHLLSWFEAAAQLGHSGFPHWAFSPAWNAGEPRFLFYPPLSWLLGALLGMVLPWTLVPAAFTWACLTLSGFAMHRLARDRVPAGQAMLAACIYLANPYMLFTAYERTAYGELLAAAIMPLLLAALLAHRLRILPIGGSVALLWLANAPAGVIGCYALAFLAGVRVLRRLRLSARLAAAQALGAVGGTLLGLALAGAYLIPAAYEQRFISADLATVEGMRIENNTLFHQMHATAATPAADVLLHDQVLATASTIACLMLSIVFAAGLAQSLRRRALRPGDGLLLLLAALVLTLLTPLSLPVWQHLPELRFLQFPWRLLILVGPLFALSLASLLPPQASPRLALPTVLALTVALVSLAWYVFHQPCDDEDNVSARLALFRSGKGTDPTDEYTPADADENALRQQEPPYWLVPVAGVPEKTPVNASVSPSAHAGGAPATVHLHLEEPEYLILNRRDYPIWLVRLNGRPTMPYTPQRADGLITLLLPAGDDTVTLTEQRTPDEIAGIALSSAAGILALALLRRTHAA